jgi:hypothetical protein
MLITNPAGPFKSITVTVSSAQLHALHTTPINLLPASGTNLITIVTGIALIYKYATIAYADGDSLVFQYAGADQDSVAAPISSLITASASSPAYVYGTMTQAAGD